MVQLLFQWLVREHIQQCSFRDNIIIMQSGVRSHLIVAIFRGIHVVLNLSLEKYSFSYRL